MSENSTPLRSRHPLPNIDSNIHDTSSVSINNTKGIDNGVNGINGMKGIDNGINGVNGVKGIDRGKISWFVGGLMIGTWLNFFTTFILVFVFLLIENHPLPAIVGSVTPQEIIFLLFRFCGQIVSSAANKYQKQ